MFRITSSTTLLERSQECSIRNNTTHYLKQGWALCLMLLLVFQVGCGSGGGSGESSGDSGSSDDSIASDAGETEALPEASPEMASPENLVAITLSASTSRVTWQTPEEHSGESVSYLIFRNGDHIAEVNDNVFFDSGLSANTSYNYHVVTQSEESQVSESSNSDSIKTLVSDLNDGLNNGGLVRTGQANLFDSCAPEGILARNFTVDSIAEADLDTCLSTIFDFHEYTLAEGLEDMRAFTARLRRQEDLELIELGQRLFHSKTLSKNRDVSCSSCHHPSLSCGGDGLSLPIGINALSPDLLGPGRTDGNAVPSVGRHSSHICNSALWLESMFWDMRVGLDESNADTPNGQVSTADVRTPDRVVSNAVNEFITESSDPLKLLMAQAHFPVSAAAEMGDSEGFESEEAYRDHLASRLDENWDDYFLAAFDDTEKNYTRVARAMAAYQASFLFIENPFFDYVDGELDALSEDEKRGAIMFWSSGSGCSNCHDGAFFTPEATRGPLYPQIGPNAVADGNASGNPDSVDKNQFRMPSLLNVGITAPYGDKGVFPDLERVVRHYDHVKTSLESFYNNKEACDLPQFSHLNDEECVALVNGGDEYILELNLAQIEEVNGEGAPGPAPRDFSDQEIQYLVSFLNSLTDPSARAGMPETRILIPARDSGPDGNQLDAVDQNGDPL